LNSYPKNIFLIGFMGCGKTTMAKKMASRIGYHCVDMDVAFTKKSGISVADFIIAQGEEEFRIQEREILKAIVTQKYQVVATGGGTPCFFDNISLMNNFGTSVYLKMTTAALASRLAVSGVQRPLLNDVSGRDLEAYIDKMLSKREMFYMQAHHTVEAFGLKPEDLMLLLRK